MNKIFDLFTDNRTGRISASKLWFNLGNAALTFAFVRDAVYGGLTDMKILAFGMVVCGSGMAAKWLNKKYYVSDNSKNDSTI